MINNPKLNDSLTLANISFSFAKYSVLLTSGESIKLFTLVLIVYKVAEVCTLDIIELDP